MWDDPRIEDKESNFEQIIIPSKSKQVWKKMKRETRLHTGDWISDGNNQINNKSQTLTFDEKKEKKLGLNFFECLSKMLYQSNPFEWGPNEFIGCTNTVGPIVSL